MPVGQSLNGSAFAADAMQYQGHEYVLGGHPGPDGSGPWDCSSFMSWILGHDFGMRLPHALKSGYDGTSHGPIVADYLTWTGAVTIPSPEAGDLCVYGPNSHIGMAISPTQMISALNPGLGTMVTPITGQANGLLVYRRIIGTVSTMQNMGCMPGAALLMWMVHLARLEKTNSQHRRARRISYHRLDNVSAFARKDGRSRHERRRGLS